MRSGSGDLPAIDDQNTRPGVIDPAENTAHRSAEKRQ